MENIIKAERLDEILKRVGAALWMLQNLETQSALFYLFKVKAERGIGFEKGTEMLIQQQRKTFGNTLRSIESANILPQELQKRFSQILAERNWLAHDSSMPGYKAIESESGTSELIERIEAIKSEAILLMKSIRELAENYAEQLQITQEERRIGLKMAQGMWFEKEII
jgi:uncharacterized protein YutE (UPF0331/DUF86 family)